MLLAVNIRDWQKGLRTLSGRWRKYRRLTKPQRRILLRAVGLLPLVAVTLRRRGFGPVQATLARFARRSPRPGRHAPPALDVSTVVAVVDLAASKGFTEANCLERSLVLWFLLRREGVDTEVRAGVQGSPGTESATFHAWVEHENRVINDTPDVGDRYQPFRLSLMPHKASFD